MVSLLLIALVWVVLGSTGVPAAIGCASCGFGDDGTRGAFLATTAIMTLVPLLALGGFILYLRFRFKKVKEANESNE